MVGGIEDLRAGLAFAGTHQVQAQRLDGGGTACLEQFQWSGNGVCAFYGRPGDGVRHVEYLPKQIESTVGQSLLQFQFVGVLQQLPGQLFGEAQHPAFDVGRLIRQAVRDLFGVVLRNVQ
ncbi:hypothetical protein D3C87_1087560 [compost metagenome]